MDDGYIVKMFFNVFYLLNLFELIWFPKKRVFSSVMGTFSDDNIREPVKNLLADFAR